jgi:hypothetical protein
LDRAISHRISPDFRNGFLLPYNLLIVAAEINAEINPEDYDAFAPADRHIEFSYVS